MQFFLIKIRHHAIPPLISSRQSAITRKQRKPLDTNSLPSALCTTFRIMLKIHIFDGLVRFSILKVVLCLDISNNIQPVQRSQYSVFYSPHTSGKLEQCSMSSRLVFVSTKDGIVSSLNFPRT